MDIESEGRSISYEEPDICTAKTGALIKASVMAGAYIAGANEEELKAVERYSENIGLAFQITDDILDVTGNTLSLEKIQAVIFKTTNQRMFRIIGIEKSRLLAQDCLKDAVESLGNFDSQRRLFMEEFARFVVMRKN